jgi:ribosomal protein L37AE/L43A
MTLRCPVCKSEDIAPLGAPFRSWHCKGCGALFGTPERGKTMNRVRKFVCGKCNRPTIHILTVLGFDEMWRCSVCGKYTKKED